MLFIYDHCDFDTKWLLKINIFKVILEKDLKKVCAVYSFDNVNFKQEC